MKYWVVLLGEKICITFECLCEYINGFLERASDKCKWYTAVALVILIIFIGIDIYECSLNYKAESEIKNTANTVFDPIVEQIDDMNTKDKELMEPLKDMVIEIKPQWVKLALLVSSSIIGIYIDIIKKPMEGIKDIVFDAINKEKDEPMMWVPFWILVVIDISEIILTFT
ncbi:hypothetical protein GH810_08905 [Acetobacterium paludosum]|uniref:Uncharacterized protein n=1 Tax=Acetobacterium paludosum TaxID=52693 RepID=A0A923KPS1_9FIRM|nr:hypothetical protein [Acetobacterium paludosum]MBC3888424.1 hypothetical protein [Acetobacterium paludosum]